MAVERALCILFVMLKRYDKMIYFAKKKKKNPSKPACQDLRSHECLPKNAVSASIDFISFNRTCTVSKKFLWSRVIFSRFRSAISFQNSHFVNTTLEIYRLIGWRLLGVSTPISLTTLWDPLCRFMTTVYLSSNCYFLWDKVPCHKA